jgi:hydroxymethylbilane synthase
VTLVPIVTEGDDLSLSLMKPAQPGAFVNTLRKALINGDVDFIVHSFKDLPSKPHDDLVLAAVPAREDHRDILVSRDSAELHKLGRGSRIGTSSPRRTAAIHRLAPDLDVQTIRGNIDSRIRKVRMGEYDATILAAAGLKRIGLEREISYYFEVFQIMPAPAQGALAVECRRGDEEILKLLEPLNDAKTRLTSTAERAVLRGLSAGCDLAISAFAECANQELRLQGEIADPRTGDREMFSTAKSIPDLAEIDVAERAGLEIASHFKNSEFGKKILARDN